MTTGATQGIVSNAFTLATNFTVRAPLLMLNAVGLIAIGTLALRAIEFSGFSTCKPAKLVNEYLNKVPVLNRLPFNPFNAVDSAGQKKYSTKDIALTAIIAIVASQLGLECLKPLIGAPHYAYNRVFSYISPFMLNPNPNPLKTRFFG
jgi:hypothetical protein